MANEKHLFYVLQCADSSLYAGYTNNLEKRIVVHNTGKGAKYTRTRLPVTCVYVEEFDTKRQAMQMEYAFKQLPRMKKLKYIGAKME